MVGNQSGMHSSGSDPEDSRLEQALSMSVGQSVLPRERSATELVTNGLDDVPNKARGVEKSMYLHGGAAAHPLGSLPYADATDLSNLTGCTGGTRVSLFLPIGREGSRHAKPRIRTKNLLRQVGHVLRADGVRPSDVDRLLAAADAAIHGARSRPVNARGLAVFIGPERARIFVTVHRVPELAVVGDRFTVTPLLPLFAPDGVFFVLALNHAEIRLFKGSRHGMEEMGLDGYALAAWQTLPTPRSAPLQAFLADRGGAGPRTVYHGVGGGSGDGRKSMLLRHFRGVDRALRDVLRNQDGPLALAAVQSMQALYRQVNTYPNLLESGIDGSPRDLSIDQLHGRAWSLAEPALRRQADTALASFHELRGTGRTVEALDEVAKAAQRRQLQSLLISLDSFDWSAAHTKSAVVRLADAPPPTVQLEQAVVATIRHSGDVFAVAGSALPDGVAAAGILRYWTAR